MSEADLQAGIVRAAEAAGWLVYHTHDARRSAAGFPDLVAVSPAGRTVYVECKTASGVLSEAQVAWLNRLRAGGAEAYLVTPLTADWLLGHLGLTAVAEKPAAPAATASADPMVSTVRGLAEAEGYSPEVAARIAEADRRQREAQAAAARRHAERMMPA